MNGPRFVATATTAVAVASFVAYAGAGGHEEGVRAVIRLTARTSLAFFLAAFVARPVRRRFGGETGRWLVRNRRALGLSFAASHFIHLGAILALARTGVTFDPPTLAVGGLGYVFVVLMTVTSNDRAVRALGKRWRMLHVTGMYYLWFVFFVTYAPRAGDYAPAAVGVGLLIASLSLRLWPARAARPEPA